MKLWEKGIATDIAVERFTVGRDREFDLMLAQYDVLGSIAHCRMLGSVGLITPQEAAELERALRIIYREIIAGIFVIEESAEDVHSQVEAILTQRLGESGKKIHTGRSRNDQILVDVKLFLRHELRGIARECQSLFDVLLQKAEEFREVLLPGYTHLQIAMPSSFGLWLGSYAESLADDLIIVGAAFRIANKNPLGSAAGYGSSFPLDRAETTRLLGFADMNYTSTYAQMTRGKSERIAAQALAAVAATLAKLSMDVTLYLSQNFGFISFPDNLTTGSSIMPHKKNPDIFELVRARCNRIQALPNEIALLTGNLPSGYHRDYQLLKEILFPAFGELRDCIQIAGFALGSMNVREDIMSGEMYRYAFSVEALNEKVLTGMSFRDAYREVAREIADSTFAPAESLHHTHEGSIGNPCFDDIRRIMAQESAIFNDDAIEVAERGLTME